MAIGDDAMNKLFSSCLQVRLPTHLKNKFNETAKNNKQIPSQLIRNFIRQYIKENTDDK